MTRRTRGSEDTNLCSLGDLRRCSQVQYPDGAYPQRLYDDKQNQFKRLDRFKLPEETWKVAACYREETITTMSGG